MVIGVIMTYEKDNALDDDEKESLRFLYRYTKKLVTSSENEKLLSAVDYMISRAESEGKHHINHGDKLTMRSELLTVIKKLFGVEYEERTTI